MVYRKFHKLCLVILTGIVVLISGMQGVVHCKTEDGHVGVKFASGVCYGRVSVEAKTTSFEGAFSSNKNDCGPCVDTPVPIHLLRVSKKPNLVNPTLQVSPTITSATIASLDFSKYQLGTELFFALNPTLASLRTIVLLT